MYLCVCARAFACVLCARACANLFSFCAQEADYAALAHFVDAVASGGGVEHFVVHARKAVLGGLSPDANRKAMKKDPRPSGHARPTAFFFFVFCPSLSLSPFRSTSNQTNLELQEAPVFRALRARMVTNYFALALACTFSFFLF